MRDSGLLGPMCLVHQGATAVRTLSQKRLKMSRDKPRVGSEPVRLYSWGLLAEFGFGPYRSVLERAVEMSMASYNQHANVNKYAPTIFILYMPSFALRVSKLARFATGISNPQLRSAGSMMYFSAAVVCRKAGSIQLTA